MNEQTFELAQRADDACAALIAFLWHMPDRQLRDAWMVGVADRPLLDGHHAGLLTLQDRVRRTVLVRHASGAPRG